MSLAPCQECGTWDAVMWDCDDGDMCLPCIEKKWAKARQEEIDRKAAIQDFYREEGGPHGPRL